MPNTFLYERFDRYLIDHGIITGRDYSKVHYRIDNLIKNSGHSNPTNKKYYENVKLIKMWIRSWHPIAPSETILDFVRVALGHLVIDELWSRYYLGSDYDIIKSAYRFYMRRGFGKFWFKERALRH